MKNSPPFAGLSFIFPQFYSPDKKKILMANLKKICSGYTQLFSSDRSLPQSALPWKPDIERVYPFIYRRNIPNRINTMGKKYGTHIEIAYHGDEIIARAVNSSGARVGMDHTLGIKEPVLSHPGFFNDTSKLAWKTNQVLKGISLAIMDGYG